MIQIFQVLTIVQGVLLILVLFKKRNQFLKPAFWLFTLMIFSVILFILGDEDNNLFAAKTDWFLFDSTLFLTFYFLFTKYFTGNKPLFNKTDLIFFVPNILYFIIEGAELFSGEGLIIEIIEFTLSLTFISYTFFSVKFLYRFFTKTWVFWCSVFISILFTFKFGLELFEILIGMELDFYEDQLHIFFLFFVTILIYFIAYKILMNELQDVFPFAKKMKYKNSNLTVKKRQSIEQLLVNKMTKDELYLEKNLTLQELSKELEVPKQYISEVLNININKSFDKFINEYRIKKFIELYQSGQYEHLTLFSIAQKAGFNSKSSFNSKFKTHTGVTPSQYFKQSTEIGVK